VKASNSSDGKYDEYLRKGMCKSTHIVVPWGVSETKQGLLQDRYNPRPHAVGELDPNPVRHLARCGTTMLAARLYARKATNHGGSQMRALLACAIIITTAVGLAGCFHHQQATYAEPIARPPLK
jgi:hypothetical protein